MSVYTLVAPGPSDQPAYSAHLVLCMKLRKLYAERKVASLDADQAKKGRQGLDDDAEWWANYTRYLTQRGG